MATIYNGFDAAEFAKVRGEIRSSTSSLLELTFVGAVTDVSWPGTLLEALARCPETLRRDIRLSFVGLDLTGRLQQEIDRLGLREHVELVGYVSHAEAVRALLRSDVLYLPVSERVHPSYVPGKLFEYLGSLKPVLATVPEGETAALLKRAGSVWLCGPRDVRCVVESLRELHSLWAKRALPSRDVAAVREFDRREQAKVLAGLLDKLSIPRR
ncbi:MAG: glycosyltransferase family 4 protein [Calditrichaeota bacterium]|nr:glycosyltransferase family 4 protein [Calditrichota bacterium]